MIKPNRPLKCRVCGKILRSWNKRMFCYEHDKIIRNSESRLVRKLKQLKRR